MILENYGYAGDTNNILKLGIYRILTPLHMIFQIAMAYFLNKAYCNRKENKKQEALKMEILAIFIPSLLHTIWNYYFADLSIKYISFKFVVIIGIICYGIIAFTISKLKDDENEEKVINSKKKGNVFKIIAIILFVTSWVMALYN